MAFSFYQFFKKCINNILEGTGTDKDLVCKIIDIDRSELRNDPILDTSYEEILKIP